MAATVSTRVAGDCHAIAPHHLTAAERCQIEALRKSGLSQAAIARALNHHPATISRERTRNRGQRGDRHQQAQRLVTARRQAASAPPPAVRSDSCSPARLSDPCSMASSKQR